MTGRANEMASAMSAAKGVGGGPPCEDRGKEEKTERENFVLETGEFESFGCEKLYFCEIVRKCTSLKRNTRI